MITSLEWMMNAIARVKMNDPKQPRPAFESPSIGSGVQFSNQATTNPTQ
jgi:hypothetical protein